MFRSVHLKRLIGMRSILLQRFRLSGFLTDNFTDILKFPDTPQNKKMCSCGKIRDKKKPTFVFKWETADLDRLNPSEMEIHEIHKQACENGENRYSDPSTGFLVFTEYFHRKRGYCCGSGCRHALFAMRTLYKYCKRSCGNSL